MGLFVVVGGGGGGGGGSGAEKMDSTRDAGCLPWYGQVQLLLHLHLRCEYPDQTARRRQHDQHPYVQLDRRPVVSVDPGYAPGLVDVRGCARRC